MLISAFKRMFMFYRGIFFKFSLYNLFTRLFFLLIYLTMISEAKAKFIDCLADIRPHLEIRYETIDFHGITIRNAYDHTNALKILLPTEELPAFSYSRFSLKKALIYATYIKEKNGETLLLLPNSILNNYFPGRNVPSGFILDSNNDIIAPFFNYSINNFRTSNIVMELMRMRGAARYFFGLNSEEIWRNGVESLKPSGKMSRQTITYIKSLIQMMLVNANMDSHNIRVLTYANSQNIKSFKDLKEKFDNENYMGKFFKDNIIHSLIIFNDDHLFKIDKSSTNTLETLSSTYNPILNKMAVSDMRVYDHKSNYVYYNRYKHKRMEKLIKTAKSNTYLKVNKVYNRWRKIVPENDHFNTFYLKLLQIRINELNYEARPMLIFYRNKKYSVNGNEYDFGQLGTYNFPYKGDDFYRTNTIEYIYAVLKESEELNDEQVEQVMAVLFDIFYSSQEIIDHFRIEHIVYITAKQNLIANILSVIGKFITRNSEYAKVAFQLNNISQFKLTNPIELPVNIKTLTEKYDVLYRKTELRENYLIKEVDMALDPEYMGLVDDMRLISPTGSIYNEKNIFSFGEKVFAKTFDGALNFSNLMNHSGRHGARYYAIIFPKGMIDEYSLFIGRKLYNRKVLLELQRETNTILVDKIEPACAGGQIHFSMRKRMINGKMQSVFEFMRSYVAMVVEYDTTGKILNYTVNPTIKNQE